MLGKRHRLGKRRLGLGRGNHFQFLHPRKDLVALRESRAAVFEGTETVRASDQPGENGGLGEREVARRLSKAGA